MLGRVWLFSVLFVVLVLASVACAGGVAVAVPSCQNVQAVAVQSYGVQAVQVQQQFYQPMAVAVPVQQRVQFVQAPQYVAVQQVQAVQAVKLVQVRNQHQPQRLTAVGAAIQAFRDQRFRR